LNVRATNYHFNSLSGRVDTSRKAVYFCRFCWLYRTKFIPFWLGSRDYCARAGECFRLKPALIGVDRGSDPLPFNPSASCTCRDLQSPFSAS